MGTQLLGRLLTRAVLLTALCGLALGLAGSMSVHRQQYFGAEDCGEAVWDVNVVGADRVWSALEAALTGRDLTAMVTGADPGLFHVAGPAASCLTGVDEQTLGSTREAGGFLVRGGGMLAARAVQDGQLATRPAVVVPPDRWRGLPSVSLIQPTPVFDDSSSYVGFLVGDAGEIEDLVRRLRESGLEVEAAPAATAAEAALRAPTLSATTGLTALTCLSVTAFWALTLHAGQRPAVRVLRLLGVSPLRAAASRWAASAAPFAAAAALAAALWLGMILSGTLTTPAPGTAALIVAGAILADAALVALTHVGALWMKRAPR